MVSENETVEMVHVEVVAPTMGLRPGEILLVPTVPAIADLIAQGKLRHLDVDGE